MVSQHTESVHFKKGNNTMTIAIIASVSALTLAAILADIRNRRILTAEAKAAAETTREITSARAENKPSEQDRKADAARMQYLRNEAQRLGVTVVHYAK